MINCFVLSTVSIIHVIIIIFAFFSSVLGLCLSRQDTELKGALIIVLFLVIIVAILALVLKYVFNISLSL